MSGLTAKRILVPVDFSDMSVEAIDTALKIVDDDGSVDVLHVLEILPAMDYGNLYGTVTDESRIEYTKKSLQKKLSEPRYVTTSLHVCIGDPGHQIADFAQRSHADLIVLPSHGYGMIKHMLVGSVAERVVRLAHCPVLVLRK